MNTKKSTSNSWVSNVGHGKWAIALSLRKRLIFDSYLQLFVTLSSLSKSTLRCVCVSVPSSMLQTVSEWLWWERLWLPVNVSWSDLEDSEGRVYAKGSHLFSALPCALCMLLVRYLFERWDLNTCPWARDPSIALFYKHRQLHTSVSQTLTRTDRCHCVVGTWQHRWQMFGELRTGYVSQRNQTRC